MTTFDSQLIMIIKYLLNKCSLKGLLSQVYSINKHFYEGIGFIEIVIFYLSIHVNTTNNQTYYLLYYYLYRMAAARVLNVIGLAQISLTGS